MAYTGNRYEIIPHLESLGETKVRELLPTGEFGDSDSILRSVVDDWLRSKESIRKAASEERSESRAERAISIARCANIIAIIAIILSASAIIIQIIQWSSKP